MPSTKIINVQKGDSFEELFRVFSNTDAQEVIFIVPKSSKLSKNESYLSQIKDEAVKSSKLVSIMTSDPVMIHLATNLGIELLTQTQPKSRTPAIPISQAHPVEIKTVEENGEVADQYQENIPEISKLNYPAEVTEEETDEIIANDPELRIAETFPSVSLTVNKTKLPEIGTKKIIRDIIRDEPEKNLEVEESDSDTYDVEIKKESFFSEKASEIEKVWSKELSQSYFPKVAGIRKFPKWILLVVVLVVILGGVLVYGSFSKATVTIYPEKQTLDFQMKISASSEVSSVDSEANIIPGQLFSSKADESGIFPVTGQKNVVQKASGKITVYNRTNEPQKLVATTRFESPKGLIFRIPETITVPPATMNGSQAVFGSVETLVYADRPGSEYNIEVSRFTIPGLKETPKYDSFFALSTAAMTGGLIGPSKVITEEDFSKAQQELSQKVKDKLAGSLQDEAKELKTIASSDVKINLPDSNAKVGEAAEFLKMTVSGTAQTMAFREGDIKNIVNDYLVKNESTKASDDDINLSYQTSVLSNDSTSLSFTVLVSGKAYKLVDKDKIVRDLLGMNENAIRSYFMNSPGIDVRVTLSPFWTKKVPSNPSRINLVIFYK